MDAEVTQAAHADPVRQFAVFAENKVGRLNELIGLLGKHNICPVALSTQDTTDSTIIRMVVDDPDQAGILLHEHGYAFTMSELTVVELQNLTDLRKVLTALMAAEINIHFLYPFVFRPRERSALAICLEDGDLARTVLTDAGFATLTQSDITR
jgi:hypothetical protein